MFVESTERRYWNAESQSKDKHRSNYNDSCDEKAQSNDYNREKSHNRHSLHTPLLCGLGVFCTFSLVAAVDILWLFCIALHWDGKCIKSENTHEDRLNYRGSELAHWESVHCSFTELIEIMEHMWWKLYQYVGTKCLHNTNGRNGGSVLCVCMAKRRWMMHHLHGNSWQNIQKSFELLWHIRLW